MGYHCFSEKLTTAKAQHRCIWCCHQILTGSKYVREHSVYDGHHQNFAWHEACRAHAVAGWKDGADEEFISGNEMPFFALYQLECAAPTPSDRREGL
ncbi:MAG: hypothetical protein Q7T60_17090 [Sphingopyxis sp.]|nr:hypothetical protein [Sphingopyxis sp.]